jgi:hypothetical protein
MLLPLPMFSVGPCGEQVSGKTTGGDGKTTGGDGTSKSGGGPAKASGTGAGGSAVKESGSVNGARVESLLPLPGNYVQLSFGSFEVVNSWALLFFTIIWVAVIAGISAIIVLARNSGKTKRRRS